MNIDSKIRCVKSEIKRREKCYPLIILDGRMNQDYADLEIETMKQVLQTLTQLKGLVTL